MSPLLRDIKYDMFRKWKQTLQTENFIKGDQITQAQVSGGIDAKYHPIALQSVLVHKPLKLG